MTDRALGWESLVHTDSARTCSLKAALLTTYDRADARFLAEHLLPTLLKLTREPDGNGKERKYFLLELDDRLKQLHGRLVVVSSLVRDEPEDREWDESDPYGWIWRSIRPLTVGGLGRAVQHAKIWLLHWGAADEGGCEYLEIVVSSANLTQSAFRTQLQAAWRVCIELHSRPSHERLRGWGVLPSFLEELGASAKSSLASFAELLARADCPEGVTFVASVPGTHSPRTLRRVPWGLAGLSGIAPAGRGRASVSVLSPYVGKWKDKTLRSWCAAFGGAPECLELVWIDANHPWAQRWCLPKDTCDLLSTAGAQFSRLAGDDVLHDEHQVADVGLRWSHAKVYSFRKGKSQRVLVTSANFSAAAWGHERMDGSLQIENFELGVCVDKGRWPLDGRLGAFDDPSDLYTVSQEPSRATALISWAQATWDGAHVHVKCRATTGSRLQGALQCAENRRRITNWTQGPGSGLWSAQIAWTSSKHPPSTVELTCEDERTTVPVFDERPLDDIEQSLPPDVDPAEAQEMRDALLFERYGGRAATEDEDVEPGTLEEELGDRDPPPITGQQGLPLAKELPVSKVAPQAHSYEVVAFSLARRSLGIVDNWATRVAKVAKHGAAEFERAALRRDGTLLREAFERRAKRACSSEEKEQEMMSIGPRIAAEELALRLERFPEA